MIFVSEVLVLIVIGVPMFLAAILKNKLTHGDCILISLMFFSLAHTVLNMCQKSFSFITCSSKCVEVKVK